jgi:hypothetical protein
MGGARTLSLRAKGGHDDWKRGEDGSSKRDSSAALRLCVNQLSLRRCADARRGRAVLLTCGGTSQVGTDTALQHKIPGLTAAIKAPPSAKKLR